MSAKELEGIFSYAVAMDQSGKQRNTVLCSGKEVFIINYDKTIILSFLLSKLAGEFKEPISFEANDYDSSKFYIEDGSVVFESHKDGFIKKKKCGTGDKEYDFETISDLYLRYSRAKASSTFSLKREVMDLLEDGLSHVEIRPGEDGGITVVQRDIFSGTVITITKEEEQGLGVFNQDKVEPFDPIGLRTIDLDALFNYDRELKFSFIPEKSYFLVKGKTTSMMAILGHCVYDELGTIAPVK